MEHPFEQSLTDADRELLRGLAADPNNNDLRSALKQRIVNNPAIGVQLIDMLGATFHQIAVKTAALSKAQEAVDKIASLETSNRFIGEYIGVCPECEADHEIYVIGQGEKVIPLSPGVEALHAAKPLRPGEKVYVGGCGAEMVVVQRTETPSLKHGEHGILIAIADDKCNATVSMDGKQFEYQTTWPVQEHFTAEKLTAEDLPLPVLVSVERHQVTKVLPEPAISSELNPFLKRDVTLDQHAGYKAVKDDFLRTVLARYMARMENSVYLKETDLTPEKLRSEAVGIACVGQPGSGKTTMINACINWLDALSLLQIQEKISVLRLYTEVHNPEQKCAKKKALVLYGDVQARFQNSHAAYRKHFDLEEPTYDCSTVEKIKKWSKSYIEGYGINPERAHRVLKRYLKMQAAARSEVQLFLVRHEDVFKKYVGEGVGYLGLVFRKARRHNGFVFVWLPEAETIFRARGTGVCSDYNDEIVAKFNEELAGSSSNDNLIAVCDSNHPQSMDDAILGHRFVRLNIGRIQPVDLPSIVDVHVKRLDLDESLNNGFPATEVARNLICEYLLASKPLAEAQQANGQKLQIYPKDVLVPRVIAFIASRARKYSLSRKGRKKRVNESDITRACQEEIRHQAGQIKPQNLHLFMDIDPNEQVHCTHVNPLKP